MKPLNLRANRGKTPNTTLGQQFPWQVPSGPHATFLQHFFLAVEFTAIEKTPKTSQQWVRPISSALAALSRKDSLSQYKNQKLVMKPLNLRARGQNTKNYSWATMPEASAFTPTCNISSALVPLSRKNSLNQHFFIQKTKNLWWNRWIYEPMGAKHQKLLLGNNSPGKCLQAHMQHFFSPSRAIEKRFAESAFFSYKNQKLVMKPLNLRANGGKTPKTIPGQQCPWQVPSRPHTTFLQP